MATPDLVIDITRLLARRLKGRRPTGVDRVGLAYVAHFGPRATALVRLGGRWLFFAPADSQRLFAALADEAHGGLGTARRLLVWRALSPQRSAPPRGAWLINAVHSGLERPDYGRQLGDHGLRALVVLHDLIPIDHPQLCRDGEAERHRARIDTALRHGRALVVNSFDTLRRLQAHALHRSLGLPPCTVAHLGVDLDRRSGVHTMATTSATDAAAPTADTYFLAVGTIEPRKNLALLLDLWRCWVAQEGAQVPLLVVIGQRGWLCDDLMERLARADPARSRVLYRAGCSDAELAAWMRGARALLFPSLAEGFGLPLVEALALGVPVIASDLPVFREVVGSVPEYLPVGDTTAWARALAEYSAPCSMAHAAQHRRLAHFEPPRWSAHFARVDGLLEHAHVDAA